MAQNPHASVSNQPHERIAVEQEALLRPPSHGIQQQSALQTSGGSEQADQVEGRSLLEFAKLPASVWSAPRTADLRDIGEASFGPPPDHSETVHGPDNRAQIPDPSQYPWRANASLLITAADGSTWMGTAWFIGSHTLATAGHCVYIAGSHAPGRNGWVRSIQVMPGRNGVDLPYGYVTSTVFHSVGGWTATGNEIYDYGAIVIPTDLGDRTGWLGIGTWPDIELIDSVGNIAGYPADKSTGTQWFDNRRLSTVTPVKVFYDIDTAGGQSGTAVYRVIDGERYGFAIHAYGGATVNSGTRINRDVYENLSNWAA